jgi:hypothetical protein
MKSWKRSRQNSSILPKSGRNSRSERSNLRDEGCVRRQISVNHSLAMKKTRRSQATLQPPKSHRPASLGFLASRDWVGSAEHPPVAVELRVAHGALQLNSAASDNARPIVFVDSCSYRDAARIELEHALVRLPQHVFRNPHLRRTPRKVTSYDGPLERNSNSDHLQAPAWDEMVRCLVRRDQFWIERADAGEGPVFKPEGERLVGRLERNLPDVVLGLFCEDSGLGIVIPAPKGQEVVPVT